MRKPAHLVFALVAAAAGMLANGCSSVDCEILCQKTLACDIAFAPDDDPDEQKILTGKRSELESCALGCEESPTVNVDNADCVDGVPPSEDVDVCQPPILECLGLGEVLGTGEAA